MNSTVLKLIEGAKDWTAQVSDGAGGRLRDLADEHVRLEDLLGRVETVGKRILKPDVAVEVVVVDDCRLPVVLLRQREDAVVVELDALVVRRIRRGVPVERRDLGTDAELVGIVMADQVEAGLTLRCIHSLLLAAEDNEAPIRQLAGPRKASRLVVVINVRDQH